MPIHLERIHRALGNVKLPKHLDRWIDSYVYEVGEDWNGDPAIFVWVIMDDKAPRSVLRAESLERIENAVHRALESLRRWPYVYFRTASEQAELEQ